MSASLPHQLTLDLPHRPALGAEDFLLSDSNRAAVAMIDLWPSWPQPVLVLSGPAGSGKSHLAHVWRQRSGARTIAAGELTDASVMANGTVTCAIVEDVDRGIADERAMFHLLNLAREHRFHILVTARTDPGDWALALPDLRSRLRQATLARIAAPDDSLLRAVLVKLFADRQLAIEPAVVDQITTRMERSMQAAVQLVAEIDKRSLETQRKVSRTLVAQVLGARADGMPDDGDGEGAAGGPCGTGA
jgi:chromosomal replication initiation ATPase DnaA